MSQLLEKYNIEVPDELEKPANSSKHCHSAQFQGDINYALSARDKSFPHIYDIDLPYNISKSELTISFFDNPPISLLDSSPNDCDFSLDPNLSLRNYSSLHNYELEAYL